MSRITVKGDRKLTIHEEDLLLNEILGEKLSHKLIKEVKKRTRKSDTLQLRRHLIEHICRKYVKKKYPQRNLLPNAIEKVSALNRVFVDLWDVYTDIICESTCVRTYFCTEDNQC